MLKLSVWLAAAYFGPSAAAQSMPFQLEATEVAFDASASAVVATGEPVRVRGTQGTVTAQRVRYDLTSNRLFAEENVTFTDPSGTTLKVARLELTGDLRAGTLDQLRLGLPQLGEVGQASSASLVNELITLEDVAYSPCKSCGDGSKPWQIEADQAVYNIASSTMTYHDARLKVYGVPVAYLPWFRHPLGTAKPQSGLLPPSFGRSQTLGEQVSVGGYLYRPEENADYLFKTRLMSARGAQFVGERRQVGTQLSSELKGSFMNDIGLPQGQSGFRGNANAEVQYDVDERRRLGLNAEVASDDTYLNQYFNRNDPYLASTAFAEQADAQSYLGANLTWFQDLNPAARPESTAQVLPHLQASRWWALGPTGGQLELNGDALMLNRGQGTDTRRLATRAAYTLPWLLKDGSKLTLGATGRADIYNVSGQKNGAIARLLPESTLTWEKPYLSPDGYHQLAPKAMLAFSPRGGNLANKIPNEDSVSYELDTTNLFEPSRFAGLDRVETGPRLVYGLDSRWGDADRTDYRIFVGQSLRKFDDASLPASGGASTNVSDWVAETEGNPTDWLSMGTRFRLDNSSWQLRRMDASLRLGEAEGANLQATYSFLDNRNENLIAQAGVPLGRNWRLDGRTQHDFRTSTLLEAEAGVTWFRDCYAIELLARRKGFENANLRPGTDYLLNVQLLTLGRGVGIEGDSR
ncbi:MAG: LPS-assembly protein LptD [Alphaproteobacteria bacterium]|nr:LPS-assembly protein LptD [Alphaproteobacteria bacterium]